MVELLQGGIGIHFCFSKSDLFIVFLTNSTLLSDRSIFIYIYTVFIYRYRIYDLYI